MPKASRIFRTVRQVFQNDQLVLGGLALFLGLLVGGAIVVFRETIDLIQFGFWGTMNDYLPSHTRDLSPIHVVLAPTIGGLLLGLYYWKLMPGGRPQGVADVIEGSVFRGGLVSLKGGVMSAFGAALAIGCGGSVGREGPAVHLGAAISASIAKRLRFPRPLMRTLLGCGAAAAVAASFNAPIAGVLFAHEVVVGHYALKAFAPVVIASVTATTISRSVYGTYAAFELPLYGVASVFEFPLFALLGGLSGLVAVIFILGYFKAEDVVRNIRLPDWSKPAFGGALLGVLALFYPHVLGVGYEATDLVLNGNMDFALIVALLFAKTIATILCLSTGFGGGVFSPSLTIGAMLGGVFGMIVEMVFPALPSDSGAFALIGMGAVAAAVLGAPISTVLIVFELTQDYTITVAVMVAVVIATVITSQTIGCNSFFHMQLRRKGLDLSGGAEVNLIRSVHVKNVMQSQYPYVRREASLADIRESLQGTDFSDVFVVDDDGCLLGKIDLADLGNAAFDHELDGLVIAHDLMEPDPKTVYAEDSLQDAVDKMLGVSERFFAVLEGADSRRLVGCVHEVEVLVAYNRALLEARAEERGEIGLAPGRGA